MEEKSEVTEDRFFFPAFASQGSEKERKLVEATKGKEGSN